MVDAQENRQIIQYNYHFLFIWTRVSKTFLQSLLPKVRTYNHNTDSKSDRGMKRGMKADTCSAMAQIHRSPVLRPF